MGFPRSVGFSLFRFQTEKWLRTQAQWLTTTGFATVARGIMPNKHLFWDMSDCTASHFTSTGLMQWPFLCSSPKAGPSPPVRAGHATWHQEKAGYESMTPGPQSSICLATLGLHLKIMPFVLEHTLPSPSLAHLLDSSLSKLLLTQNISTGHVVCLLCHSRNTWIVSDLHFCQKKTERKFHVIQGKESSRNWDIEQSKPEDILKNRKRNLQTKLILKGHFLLILLLLLEVSWHLPSFNSPVMYKQSYHYWKSAVPLLWQMLFILLCIMLTFYFQISKHICSSTFVLISAASILILPYHYMWCCWLDHKRSVSFLKHSCMKRCIWAALQSHQISTEQWYWYKYSHSQCYWVSTVNIH